MRNTLIALIVMLTMLAVAPFAIAIDPDEAVKARQAVLKDMGKTMKELGAIAKGDVESQREALVAAAQHMRELAPQPWAYFGQETAVARVNTEAKATIWSDPAGFRKAQDDFAAAADELALVAAKGDAKAVGEKVGALGATCGACHKQFKN